jgi:hypothetical protein
VCGKRRHHGQVQQSAAHRPHGPDALTGGHNIGRRAKRTPCSRRWPAGAPRCIRGALWCPAA